MDDIVAILKQDDVRGDPEKALDALQVKAMAEYVDRVWTPTHDDDNEYFQEAIKNDDVSYEEMMKNMYERRTCGSELGFYNVDYLVFQLNDCYMCHWQRCLNSNCGTCYTVASETLNV